MRFRFLEKKNQSVNFKYSTITTPMNHRTSINVASRLIYALSWSVDLTPPSPTNFLAVPTGMRFRLFLHQALVTLATEKAGSTDMAGLAICTAMTVDSCCFQRERGLGGGLVGCVAVVDNTRVVVCQALFVVLSNLVISLVYFFSLNK